MIRQQNALEEPGTETAFVLCAFAVTSTSKGMLAGDDARAYLHGCGFYTGL